MPKTILFVDDDDTVRELGTAILESAGHAVKAARDGREGLALIEDDPSIDVLLTDIVMPGGIDGWALADKAKRIRPDLKMLYTSGYVPRLPSNAPAWRTARYWRSRGGASNSSTIWRVSHAPDSAACRPGSAPGLVDFRDRRYNIRWMSLLATHARWLAFALWLGGLLAPAAAEEPAGRLRVPGIDAACRADANQRARTELRLQAVEWTEDPAEPAAAPSDTHAVTRIELAGRARSPGGVVRLTANCTYAKGRPAVVLIRTQPAPALDLSGVAPLPTPPRRVTAPAALAAAPGTSAEGPSPTVRLTPTLKEMPFDPLTNSARRQDFIGSHEFAIKLQTPF